MLYFLDSAKPALIERALKLYPLDGVTTNPTILARDIEEGVSLKQLLREIRRLTEGKKLFVQVTSPDAAGMARDAEAIADFLGGDLSVKVPCTTEGFEAIRILSKMSIRTTATACYTTSQALLAAKSGAEFVAPYVAHLDGLSLDGPAAAGEMARQLAFHCPETQVLAASFRTPSQVERCLALGVTSVTVTSEMLDRLSAHPGTDQEIAGFRRNWASRFDRGIAELL